MVDHHSPDPDPPTPKTPGRSEDRIVPPMPHEDQFHGMDEEDEPYSDPEHARRLAAVRTELFRRPQAKWEPEE